MFQILIILILAKPVAIFCQFCMYRLCLLFHIHTCSYQVNKYNFENPSCQGFCSKKNLRNGDYSWVLGNTIRAKKRVTFLKVTFFIRQMVTFQKVTFSISNKHLNIHNHFDIHTTTTISTYKKKVIFFAGLGSWQIF